MGGIIRAAIVLVALTLIGVLGMAVYQINTSKVDTCVSYPGSYGCAGHR